MVDKRGVFSYGAWVAFATLSIFAAMVVWSAGSAHAQTQAELNLQNRLNILTPSIAAPSPSFPDSPLAIATARVLSTSVCPPTQAASSFLSSKLQEMQPAEFESFIKRFPAYTALGAKLLKLKELLTSRHITASYFRSYFSESEICKLFTPISPFGQKPAAKLSFPFNPTYETDVLKSGQNTSPGGSAGFGGTGLFTTPGAHPFDVIALSAASASARYPDFPSKSLDSLDGQAYYQLYIDGYGYYDGNWISVDDPSTYRHWDAP